MLVLPFAFDLLTALRAPVFARGIVGDLPSRGFGTELDVEVSKEYMLGLGVEDGGVGALPVDGFGGES